MALQSSQRLPELLFYTKKSYRILQLQFQLQFYMCTLHYTTLQSRVSIQNPILHAEDKELFEYYYYIQRQRDLHSRHSSLSRHSRHSSLSRAILQVPVFPGNPTHSSILRLECIFNFYRFYVRLVSTENSTEYQLSNYILQTERDISVRIDIFSRIELFPSNVLSSEKTNCKNDIQ